MIKTTCNKHRTLGYAIQIDGRNTCRGCGLTTDQHETFDETIARQKAERS